MLEKGVATQLGRAVKIGAGRESVVRIGGTLELWQDEIGRYNFIDLREYEVGNARSFGIPYRILVPKGIEGVLVAGRSMLTDHVVHNATRNVGCCLITGQAAGTAAAPSIREGVQPSTFDAQPLRGILAENGAYFE